MSQALQSSEYDKFFGVDSLLKLNANIVFETLFSLRHSGRVMDLILHASRNFIKNCDEIETMESRIRHCLELGILSAWVNYRTGETSKTLEIEVGWDDEKLVISIAGFVPDDVGNVAGELGTGLSAATENLIRYLSAIEENSTAIYVRHQKSIGHLQTFITIAARADTPRQQCQYIGVTNPSVETPGAPGQVQVVNLPKSPLSKKTRLDRFMAEEKNEDDAREKVQQKRQQGKFGPVTKKAKDALANSRGEPVEVDDDPVVVESLEDDELSEEVSTVTGETDGPDESEISLSSEDEDDQSQTNVDGGDGESETTTQVKGSKGLATAKTKVKGIHAKEKADAQTKVKAAKEKAAAIAKVKGSKGKADSATKVTGAADENDDATTVKGFYAESDETATQVDGFDETSDDTATLVGGDEEAIADDETRVSGTTQKLGGGKAVVTGAKKSAADEAKIRLKASQKQAAKKSLTKVSGANLDDNTDGSIVTIPGADDASEVDEQEVLVSGEEFELEDTTVIEVPDPKKAKKAELIRKIKQKKKLSQQDEELLTLVQNMDEDQSSEEDLTLLVQEPDTADNLISDTKTQAIIKDLETNIRSTEASTSEFEVMVGESSQNFEKTIVKYKQVIDRVQIPDKVKQYLGTMFEEISRDRAEFEAQARSINAKWKKAQLDFKAQQGALESEIKKRDIQIRQKTVSLEKAKQMLTGAMKSLEAAKSANQSANASDNAQREQRMKAIKDKAREQVEKAVVRLEEAQKKLSIEISQKTNLSVQNAKLSKHLDDLQKRLHETEKVRQTVKEDPSVKAEKERGQRQVEELKKQNRQLQEKLTQLAAVKQGAGSANKGHKEGHGSDSSDVETKHKLEQSQKLYHKIKDDYEKTVKRLDEAKQGETKLRVEISKLQAELKTATKNNAKK